LLSQCKSFKNDIALLSKVWLHSQSLQYKSIVNPWIQFFLSSTIFLLNFFDQLIIIYYRNDWTLNLHEFPCEAIECCLLWDLFTIEVSVRLDIDLSKPLIMLPIDFICTLNSLNNYFEFLQTFGILNLQRMPLSELSIHRDTSKN